MDFVLVVLVLAAALIALAYPLYRAQTATAALSVSTLDDLLARRDGVYATLRDLELDRDLGKLDASDYNALHEKYMVQATEILQELDTLRGEGSGQEASAEIEREVAAMRSKTKDDASSLRASSRQTIDRREAIGKPSPASNVKREASNVKDEATDLHCTNCGRKYNSGDKFCARCGKALG